MSKKVVLPPVAGNLAPKFTVPDTFQRVKEMTRRLSEMRTGAKDFADKAGLTVDAVNTMRFRAAEVRVLTGQCMSANTQLRELLYVTSDASEVIRQADEELARDDDETDGRVTEATADTLTWMVGNEPRVVGLLRSLGHTLPPALAQAIERASDRIPDTQALQEAYSQFGNTVSRDESDRLEREVYDLQQKKEALDIRVNDLEKQVIAERDKASEAKMQELSYERRQNEMQGVINQERTNRLASEAKATDLRVELAQQITTLKDQVSELEAREVWLRREIELHKGTANERLRYLEESRERERRLQHQLEQSQLRVKELENEKAGLARELDEEGQRYQGARSKVVDLRRRVEHQDQQSKDQVALSDTKIQTLKDDLRSAQSAVGNLERQWKGFLHIFLGPAEPEWDLAVVRQFLSSRGGAVQSRPSWQEPWTLLPSWPAQATQPNEDGDINVIILDVIFHYGQGSWHRKGGFDVLRHLQSVLKNPTLKVLPASSVEFMFAVMAHVVDRRNSTVMVRIAAWQIMWLLADRWPMPDGQSSLNKASHGMRVLCRDKNVESLPRDFATYAPIEGSYLIKLAGSEGVIMARRDGSEMCWVDREYIKLGLGTITLSPDSGRSPRVMHLNDAGVEWAMANLS